MDIRSKFTIITTTCICSHLDPWSLVYQERRPCWYRARLQQSSPDPSDLQLSCPPHELRLFDWCRDHISV